MVTTSTNPVKMQPRCPDLAELFEKYGYIMFPQQRTIYRNIAMRLKPDDFVLEFGCGAGIGTAMLNEVAATGGTDLLYTNVQFAQQLYHWINFSQWDVCKPWLGKPADVVVSVEMLEHVEDPVAALRTMINAAKREVWLSTPNGAGKPKPPSNPYHVQEYTVDEIVAMLATVAPDSYVKILNWETFEVTGDHCVVDPLVYRIIKEKP